VDIIVGARVALILLVPSPEDDGNGTQQDCTTNTTDHATDDAL
jgi:hypothetical protein